MRKLKQCNLFARSIAEVLSHPLLLSSPDVLICRHDSKDGSYIFKISASFWLQVWYPNLLPCSLQFSEFSTLILGNINY